MGFMSISNRFLLRQVATAGLAANALRPIPGMPLSVPTFLAGWLTAELAPQLLAAVVVDSAIHVARRGVRTKADVVGLAAAGLSTAGLAAVIAAGRGARVEVEAALTSALGSDYRSAAGESVPPVGVPWRQLALPFRMRRDDVVRVRNLAYAPGGRRFRIDVYHRRDIPADAPVLLQVHGGGWVIGSKDHQGVPLMLEMASRGWVCAAVNYPLSPRAVWPAHLVAVKQAVAWLRDNVSSYGGDPGFVAVTGGSAGGHLAAMLALTANEPGLQPGFEDADTSIQACAPHYGVYDFTGETGIKATRLRVESGLMPMVLGKKARFPEDYEAASPLAHLRPDAPPFFVVHGVSDSFIPVAEAREFVRRLREVSRNPVAYAELRGAQHAFDIFPSIRSAAVVQGVADFLGWARAAQRGEGGRVREDAG
ncbi:alpha/beta hydrolase fold domain-containing protein [Rhodococcus hoagii]|nr:alpha/beta hydrolase fold domain-containing protein [Prescottella equi]MBM4639918.1 alpha/beta hydrolase fold domain-containing protein [Prescottella equi]MBM4649205.1 alpha/beta hydrolase fold domain-containing protein [Prescottella equi]MBM4666273.1 alpha/beta hydrolase fold domain-containing protein [Prescottella equi]NKT42582.1 alpha/beta hydrolase fold domain-containing protein [Prescottella equi]